MPSLRDLVSVVKRHEGKTLLPLIDRALLARNFVSKQVEGLVHPSAIGHISEICPREVFFARYTPFEKYPKALLAKVHSPRHHRIFDNGDHVHLRYQILLIEAGIVDPRRGVGWEIPLENPKMGMVGHADFVAWPEAKNEIRVKYVKSGHGHAAYPVMNEDGSIEWEMKINGKWVYKGPFTPSGDPVCGDIKSTWHTGTRNYPGFTMLFEAMPKHVSQVTCYMGLLRDNNPELYSKMRRGVILYESKEKQEIKEYEVPFNPTKWAQVRVPLLEVERCKKKEVLPKPICDNAICERATICEWVEPCFQLKSYQELIQLKPIHKADAKKAKKR